MARVNTMRAMRITANGGRSAGVVLVACGAAIWGLDGVIRAPLVKDWSTWTIVLYEHVLLTLVVLPYLWTRRRALGNLTGPGWASVVAVAWGGSALATLAFTSAFQHGNPTVVVLLQKTQPVWAVLAASIVLGERPRRRLGLIAVPALFGVYLLSFGWMSPATALQGGQAEPVLLALGAAALWGSATAFGRRALREVTPNVITGLRFTIALPLLFVLALTHSALAAPASATTGDWVRVVLVALFPGLVALVLYYRGLERVPASVATFAELAFPATSLLAGWVFLHATVTVQQLLGFAIVWICILALHADDARDPAQPPATSRRRNAVNATASAGSA
jgi:drug/metabolite transporter (DMT)-like permease